MIRINLLKNSKRKNRFAFKIPVGLLIKGGVALLAILFVYGGFTIYNKIASQKVPVETEYIVKDDFNPSSIQARRSVEDVVRDESGVGEPIDHRNNVLNVPYENLAFIEKVNYENHFLRNVMNLLQRTAQSGVDFRTLTVSSFLSVKATGLSTSREKTNAFFTALLAEKFILAPRPATSISNAKEGYAFKLEGEYRSGLDLTAPFILKPQDVPPFEDVDLIIKRVIETMQESGLTVAKFPERGATQLQDGYRRLTYTVSLRGSYSSFYNFVSQAYQRQIPFAVSSCALKAATQSSLSVDLTILLTTKR